MRIYQLLYPNGTPCGGTLYEHYYEAKAALVKRGIPPEVQVKLTRSDIDCIYNAFSAAGYSIRELKVKEQANEN